MSCCSEPSTNPKTKAMFLEEKLKNFKAFIEPYASSDETKSAIKAYDSLEAVMPFLLQAVAASRMSQTEALVSRFCEAFPTADDAFRVKVGRYFAMFCDVLTT